MSQLGRISGQLLKDNLTRNGHDLTFDKIVDANPLVAKEGLLHLDVTNRRVGINTETPEYDLDIGGLNGTIRTTNLEVTNKLDISVDSIITPTTGITITGNTITSNTGTLNLTNAAGNQVNYQAKLVVDNIELENNVISTNAGANLELRPNGTGTVDVYANTNVYGDVYVTGNIRADGNITVGDSNTDNITINADVASNIIPDQDVTYTLGNGGIAYSESAEFTLGDVTLTVSGTGTVVELSIPAAGPAWVTELTGHTAGKSYQIILFGEPGVYSVNTLGVWTGTNPQTVLTTNDSLVDGTYNVTSIRFDQKRWLDLRVSNIYTDAIVSGNLVVDGIQLNTVQGKIYYVATNGSDANAGQHQNDPFATVKKALSVAASEDTVYIYPGTYTEQFPLTVPVGVTVKGTGIRSVKIVPTTATRYNDAFLLNGETTVEDVTIADYFSGGNYFAVTTAGIGETVMNVGTAPFAHTWVSGGTINISGTAYSIIAAVYSHTTGVLTVNHTGPDATSASPVFLSGLIFSCNGGNRVFPDNGYAFRFATDFAVTSRSPYVRNITVLTKGSVTSLSDPLGYNQGDAGKGAYIDGAYATALSKEASMLFHSATFICPGVDVMSATNGARVEWLNSFTYYANRSMYLYSSADGFASDGKTRIKITNTTGTWSIGNTLSYYDTDGTTVLASGVIESIDGDFYNIDGRVLGFEIPSDRAGKTITVHGDAELSTAQVKFGTASLALDGVGDYISLASQPDFAYGTGAFTIEMWVYKTVSGITQVLLDQRTANPTNYAPVIFINASNALQYNDGAASVITGTTTVPLNAWSHVALSRSGTSTRLFLNGVQQGTTYTDTRNYIATPVTIGARFNNTQNFTGYIDDLRISKGVARYTTTFPVPTAQLTGDLNTVLLITCNGTNGSTAIVDNGITLQDLRTSAGGTASIIDFADYSDFGVELRSIGSAAVYGNYGVYGDGQGVIAYLIGQNLAYIGNGAATTNDPNTVIQANEVVELNDAKIFYNSVDHKGDFRVGDLFYVNQATGEVSFTNSSVTIGTSLTFNSGLGDVTFIDATKIETGDFRISGNTIQTLTQDFNVDAASNQINLQSNVTVTGNLDVTGDVTVGGNVTIGNESTDVVRFVAGVDSDILPALDSTYDLGTSTERWSTLYSTTLVNADIQISTNVITTTNSDLDLTLQANGTGRIYVPSNNVEITNNLTVNGTTNLSTTNIGVVGTPATVTHVGGVTQTGDLFQTGNTEITGTLTVGSTAQFEDIEIDNNVITTTLGNNDLVLEAAGSGKVIVPVDNAEVTGTLTVVGTTSTTTINNTGTVTSGTFSTGNITISGNTIQTTITNSNLQLQAAGTGFIELEHFDVQENELRINSGTDMTIAPNGTGIVNINSTQSIKLPVGDNAARPLTSTSGMIRFNTELSRYEGYIGTAWTRLDGVEDSDGNTKITAELTPGANDNTIRFIANGIQVADLTSTRLNAINVDVGAININNNVISTTTTDTNLVLSPNGTGTVRMGNFSVSSNTFVNTVNNSITLISQTGDGYVKINSTGGFVIPVGRTDQRPSIFEIGMMRYNTSDERVEVWNGTAWVGVAQGAQSGVTADEATDISILSALIFG
jgi:hypothetical protein